jgi:hypothetical protein
MKRKSIILVPGLLALAFGVASLLPAAPSHPPASVTFLGFTNSPVGSEELLATGNEPEALFRLTNNTASRLGFHIQLDAQGTGSNTLYSLAMAAGDLDGHSVYTIPVVTPRGTNKWRFVVVSSISGPRPVWQQRIRMLAARVGVHSLVPYSDRTYPQFTNLWTTP